MFALRGSRRCWVAMVAAYALALQSLLGAVLVAKAATVSTDPFAICLASEDGAPANHGGTDKSHLLHEHCVLCTIGQAAHALPGSDLADAAIERIASAVAFFRSHERAAPRFAAHDGYPRGPPTMAFA
jgi:hypothetical protein